MIPLHFVNFPPSVMHEVEAVFSSPALTGYTRTKPYDSSKDHGGWLQIEYLESTNNSTARLALDCKNFGFSQGIHPPTWHLNWHSGLHEEEYLTLLSILKWIGAKRQSWKKSEVFLQCFSRCAEQKIQFCILKNRRLTVPVSDVIHLAAKGELSVLTYGHGGKMTSVVLDHTLGICERMLMQFGVIRVHRSHLVNLGCIHSMEQGTNGYQIQLCNERSVPIARRRLKFIQEKIASLSTAYEKYSV